MSLDESLVWVVYTAKLTVAMGCEFTEFTDIIFHCS